MIDMLQKNQKKRLINNVDEFSNDLDHEEFDVRKDLDDTDAALEELGQFDEGLTEQNEQEEQEFEETKREIEEVFQYEQHNIAGLLPESTLTKIVSEIYEQVERDIESKEDWTTTIEKAIECFDFSVAEKDGSNAATSTPGNATGYKQLSQDKSWVMNKALITTAAMLDSKFLSPNNMVNFIVEDEEQKQAALELKKHFNYYLTNVQKDYISDKRVSFNYCTFDGVVFWKSYFDPYKKICVSYYISGRDIDVNATATSLDDSTRVSYKFELTKSQVDERIASTAFLDETYQKLGYSEQDDITEPVNMVDKSEELTHMYEFREVQVMLDIASFGDTGKYKPPREGELPYTLIIDWTGRRAASLTQAWRADDTNFKRKDKLVKVSYFPSFDFWPYGFAHLVAPQAKSATNHLRLIANAATYSSFPVALADSSIKNTQNNMLLEPGSIHPIKMTKTGDLRNSVVPLPFKEPSAYLDQLRQYFDEGAAQAIMALNDLGDIGANAPVGTVIQLLDKASTVPNFIMRQMYESLAFEYRIILENLKEYADFIDPQFMPFEFKELLNQFDFNTLQIVPTANPDISSQYADMIKYDAILGLLERFPDQFNQNIILRKYLETMAVTDIDQMLNSPQEVQSTTPLLENAAVREGREIKALKWQIHEAHIVVHQQEIDITANDPNLDPAEKTRRITALASHIDMHSVYQNLVQFEEAHKGEDFGDLEEMDEAIQNQLAGMEAENVIKKQAEDAKAAAEAPPQPNEMDILQREVAVNEQRVQLEAAKMEHQNQIEQMKVQRDIHLAEIKQQTEKEIALLKAEIDQQKSLLSNDVDVKRMHMEMQKFMADMEVKMTTSQDALRAKLQSPTPLIMP